MSVDLDHFGGIRTIVEHSNLVKRRVEHGSRSVDGVDMNIFISEKAFDVTSNHKVEVVKHSSSTHSGQAVSSNDAAKDQIEQSVGESSDVVIYCDDECDASQHIDSVFYACDHTSAGTVAVSDIITYLRDTLHVSYS